MTRVGPEGWPRRTAEGKTEKAITKLRQKEIAMPGTIRGKSIFQKVCHLFAPSIWLAFSRSGLMPDT